VFKAANSNTMQTYSERYAEGLLARWLDGERALREDVQLETLLEATPEHIF